MTTGTLRTPTTIARLRSNSARSCIPTYVVRREVSGGEGSGEDTGFLKGGGAGNC